MHANPQAYSPILSLPLPLTPTYTETHLQNCPIPTLCLLSGHEAAEC